MYTDQEKKRVTSRRYMAVFRREHREELRAYREEWEKKNARRLLGYRLKRKFGLTVEDYDALLAKQGGVCAICKHPPSDEPHQRYLAVDHDHVTNTVRGLLCFHCNTGLGNLRDSVEILQLAIRYLKGVL